MIVLIEGVWKLHAVDEFCARLMVCCYTYMKGSLRYLHMVKKIATPVTAHYTGIQIIHMLNGSALYMHIIIIPINFF